METEGYNIWVRAITWFAHTKFEHVKAQFLYQSLANLWWISANVRANAAFVDAMDADPEILDRITGLGIIIQEAQEADVVSYEELIVASHMNPVFPLEGRQLLLV